MVLLVVPLVFSDAWVGIAVFAAIAAIGAAGLNLLTGLAGLVSIGHGFFIGIGAYTAAVLGGDSTMSSGAVALGLPWPVWLVGAGLVAAAVGAAVGPLALRFRGLYLAVVTLALVYIGAHVFSSVTPLTGGSLGRFVPSPQIGSLTLSSGQFLNVGWISLGSEQRWYYFVLVIALPLLLAARNVTNSRTGRALRAVRGRDLAAAVIGVNVTRYKVSVFALSSLYAGVAGALFASYVGSIRAETFGLDLSIQYLAMVIIGGLGSPMGAVLGAIFVTALPQVARDLIPGGVAGFNVYEVSVIAYGVILAVFLIAYPEGLAGMWAKIKLYWRNWPFRS